MSALDDAKAEVARLEKQQKLEDALEAAGDALAADSTDATRAKHNKASEALADHRAAFRSTGGPRVGGDAVMVTPENGEGE